jgi:peptidoglycan/xylan/chitin deacetylase (PgdA/CDA1 family)
MPKLVPILLLVTLLFNCCKKLDTKGRVTEPGICLTFDDDYIEEWVTILPMLDSFNVKVTFYLSYYNRYTPERKRLLKMLQRHGHEIAFHSTNHYNFNNLLKNTTMDKLVKSEIFAGLNRMHADGFYPTTFAYPYGQHNPALDAELLKYFKSIRARNGTSNMAKSLAKTTDNRILYGLGIDDSSKRPINDILQLVTNAKSDNACLVLVAHHVEYNKGRMQVSYHMLRRIIRQSIKEGLNFYTVSQISGP